MVLSFQNILFEPPSTTEIKITSIRNLPFTDHILTQRSWGLPIEAVIPKPLKLRANSAEDSWESFWKSDNCRNFWQFRAQNRKCPENGTEMPGDELSKI